MTTTICERWFEGFLRRAGYVVVGVASGFEAHPLALKTCISDHHGYR